MAEVDQRVQNNYANQSRPLPPRPEFCCGYSVQTVTKIIAIFSMVMDFMAIIALGLLLSFGLKEFYGGTERGVLIGTAVGGFLCALMDIGFSIFLLKGANQTNLKYVRIWIIYAKVLTGISIGLVVVALVLLNIVGVVGQAFSVAKYVFFIFVVNKFRKDVEENPSRYTMSNGVNA